MALLCHAGDGGATVALVACEPQALYTLEGATATPCVQHKVDPALLNGLSSFGMPRTSAQLSNPRAAGVLAVGSPVTCGRLRSLDSGRVVLQSFALV